jgi:hypothetical protein
VGTFANKKFLFAHGSQKKLKIGVIKENFGRAFK